MNVRQLEAFRAAMKLGNFTRAGEQLHLSQPAVSKLIYLLERKCGFSLFIRHKNGVTPTPEGEMLFEEVERVFQNVDSVNARARAIRELNYGRIEVVAFPSFCCRVLPKIVAEYLEDHPGIDIRLASRNSSLLVDRVATQGVDIGFGMIAPERAGVEFEKVCNMNAVCVMSPNHSLAERSEIDVADLEGERFISLLEEDRCQLEIDAVFARHKVSRNVVLKCQLTETCCSFAAAGLGISIVDPMSAAGFDASELLVKQFQPEVKFDIWALKPAFRSQPQATKNFVAHIKSSLQNMFGE